MRVIGIDPGVSGALAVVNYDGGQLKVEAIHDLPIYTETSRFTGKVRRSVDPLALAKLIKAVGPVDRVIVERMIAPPGVSGVSAFSMGATMATITTVLRIARLEYALVMSSIWKRGLDCPPDKEAARQYASKLFGDDKHWPLKRWHNRAEAALIAAYGAVKHVNERQE